MTKYCYIEPKFTVFGIGRDRFDKPTVIKLRGNEIQRILNVGKIYEVYKDGSIHKLNQYNYKNISENTITDFSVLPTVKDVNGEVITDDSGNPKFPGTDDHSPTENENNQESNEPAVASLSLDENTSTVNNIQNKKYSKKK